MPYRFSTTPFALVSLLLAASPAVARDYYVDAVTGDDRRDAVTAATAWKSLARVRSAPLLAGDRVLLTAGSVWREPLEITRSGKQGAPIIVGRTGTGARPRIDVGGLSQYGIAVTNAEYVSVSGIEITNDNPPAPVTPPGTTPPPPLPPSGPRFGVLVSAQDSGVTRGISVTDMFIHDIRGVLDRKDNGGIVFRALGQRLRTRFEGITIARNIVWRVDRSGIAGISDQVTRARWFPSRGVVIRDNYLEDIGGDGIVPRGADAPLVEHNIVKGAAARAPGYNVAIWQWSTDNALIQLNEASFTKGRYDGQGFDADYNSRRTTIIHNYSHDNEGGFILICSPRRNDTDNLGNRQTLVRFNVSRNDGARIFQLSGGITDAHVDRNVVHVAAGTDVQMAIATEWQGWASDVRFSGNRLAVAGTARYGHESGRSGPDYLLAEGFPPAEDIRFRGNQYLGSHVGLPDDPDGTVTPLYKPPVSDWAVPTFDPAKPDGFTDYLARHRTWMLAMLGRELGQPVRLLSARASSLADSR